MSRIIILLLLIVGLGAGLYLVQHPQIFKPKAYEVDGDGNPIPKQPDSYKLQKGFQIDPSDPAKIPPKKIFNSLNPQWVRFVYFVDKGVPSSIPNNVKVLLVFNNEASPEIKTLPQPKWNIPPLDQLTDEEKIEIEKDPNINRFWGWYRYSMNQDNYNAWKQYIDQKWIPVLDNFLKSNQRVDAIQIWNEPDLCNALTGSCIPPESYAYMLKQSALKIRSYERNIKIVIGGLASQQWEYLPIVKRAEPGVFSLVDAVGVHPYGLSPDGWCKYYNDDAKGNNRSDHPDEVVNGTTRVNEQNCLGHDLPFGDVAEVVNKYKEQAEAKEAWVTEIGQTADSENWQVTYLEKLSKTISRINVPVFIWFSWTDRMLGPLGKEGNDDKWGLIDDYGNIKAVGVAFQEIEL